MKRLAIGALAVLALAVGAAWYGKDRTPGEPLPLFTSLPIYWSETPDIATALGREEPPHWARQAIEEARPLRPLDTLDAAHLRGRRDLLMIQPRPLSPAENVALDSWVGEGGHLLLFADPALTGPSAFALGDRRRPQDTVLLSPILARWGLRLEFDAGQASGEHVAEIGQARLAVNLPGRFAAQSGGRADGTCRIEAGGLAAGCRIGKGTVLAIADAALFEPADDATPRETALAVLLERAF
ncbi:DUF4350 domain-containing protein [Novosphingobium sp. Gsoil 351]|uniref:DUF4350 domain-containing protein n=1 Tax=Novosphingobium sp. Gsoil 351 TaxID=2675225 RepID=UPI0012B487EF|nr:DUF4350 domain-containing protein [Novosphingobium sp. Gsoil 351]QGN55564.1 ABC transporter [Novosphingobium sp. Gsoil 351]